MTDVPGQPPLTDGPLRGQIVQSSPGSLTAPHNVVQTIIGARALHLRYRSQHIKRINLYAMIEGLISGNPPYDPAQLEQLGLSHIANFNNMDARAFYERLGLSYWNLVNQTELIAKFEFKDKYNPELLRYANIMAREWNNVVRDWRSFETQMGTLSGQLVKFGYSPLVWPDERDWRWKTVEVSRFLLPDEAPTDLDLMTIFFVETLFTVQQLYEIYQTYKDVPKDKSPWNIDELALFLIDRANTWAKFEPPIWNMMDFQTKFQNRDLSWDTLFTDEVRLVSMLQKEYDGKFSHYIFSALYSFHGPQTMDGSGFLYFVDRQYESLDEMLALFTASPGEFTIHSNRGLGHKIFAACQATMQLDCDIINMARLSSTPIIKSPAVGAQDFEAIQFKPGVPTNIGNAEFVQNQLGANIEGLVFAGNYMLTKLENNLNNSGDNPRNPDQAQGSISPSQAKMKSFKEFAVLKDSIAHFYTILDRVFKQMLYKMNKSKSTYPGGKEAVRWKKSCIEQGVPELLLSSDSDGIPKFYNIKATRVAGDGSTLAMLMGLESLGAIVGSFGAKGQKEYQRLLITATLGPDYVAPFIGVEEPDETSGGASLAGVENAMMKSGEQPIFSPDNEQRAHIKVHFELARFIIEARSQQQLSARDADRVFTVLMPHLGEHISNVASNPFQQQFFDEVRKSWDQLQEYARLNRKNAEEEIKKEIRDQQAAQAAQQRTLSEEELKNIKAQGDAQRADFKVEQQVERAREANENRAQVMREKTLLDADNQRLKIRLEAQTNKEKAVNENSLEKNRQDLANMTGGTIAPADIEGVPQTGGR